MGTCFVGGKNQGFNLLQMGPNWFLRIQFASNESLNLFLRIQFASNESLNWFLRIQFASNESLNWFLRKLDPGPSSKVSLIGDPDFRDPSDRILTMVK